MDNIKELVQVLVILIMLVVFLEMLLPNGQMYGYVKMVMGLVVIVVVLEAGANLLGQDLKFDLPALGRDGAGPTLERIMLDGQKMAGEQKQRAMDEYRQGLERQVMALAKLNGGIYVTGAKIETSSNPQGEDYGRLTGVVLEVSRKGAAGGQEDENAVREVKPVDIKVESNGLPEPLPEAGVPVNSEAARELAQTVANFYNIPVDRVKIVETKT